MAVIGPRIKKQTGTVTTDGAGAAAVSVAVPTGVGGARGETYKLIDVEVAQDVTAPLTGGTVNVRDNNATGTAVNYTIAVATDFSPAGLHKVHLNAPLPVTNIRFTVAGGGATKAFKYRLTYARTRAH